MNGYPLTKDQWKCKCQSHDELYDFDKTITMIYGYMNKKLYCSKCEHEIKFNHSLKNKILIALAITGIPLTLSSVIYGIHLGYCFLYGQSALGSWGCW